MNTPFGMPPFDPSKMDPKVLMELSQLFQKLPPDKLMKMQSMMHNMMAGFDVRAEMQEFEKSLPPDFLSKMMTLMGGQMGEAFGPHPTPPTIETSSTPSAAMNLREARLTILRGVAEGKLNPEEAERLLFQA
jgi:hypothetical protein